MPVLTGQGILTTETMLRMAQAEIDALKTQVGQDLGIMEKLKGRLHEATLAFCAVVLQAGGTVTITPAELDAGYTMSVRIDPATHAKVWTIAKKEPELVVTN
jgi:hypothetical protein